MTSNDLGTIPLNADASSARKHHPALSSLPDCFPDLRRPSKSALFFQGDAAATFFIIKSGWVRQYLLLEDGRRHILDFATSGDIIGLSAHPNGCHDCTAEAITDIVVTMRPSDILADRHMTSRLDEMNMIMTHLARESRRMHKLIAVVSSLSASERILYLLTDLFLRARKRLPVSGDILPLPLNQQMIADAIGLTPVHVSRTMSLLRLDNIVSFRSGMLTVMDPGQMLRMSHIDPEDYAGLSPYQEERMTAF